MAKKNLKYSAEKIDELLTKADEQMATKSDLTKKVDKVDGKGLSTNDYSTADKAKLASIQEGAQKNTVTSVKGAFELNKQVGDVVITAASIGLGDTHSRLTSLENNKLDKSEKGATNGVASLDENGRVPSSQLPSYVDDVIDDLNYAQFPATGETGKIYIAKDTNKTYRWSGSGYAEVSASLALGETEQTAYSGAKGKKNAEDIAKLAKDLDVTHQLASNAESAISEVVELTIPAIESDVANKATKSEAQGYATTAKNEANAYTDSEVEKLATVAPIAAGKIVKLTFGWTVSTLISFNATTGHTKDLFYYATYGTGTSACTKYNFLHQSGSLKIYIDESNTGTILYLHNTTQAGTMSVNNLIPSTVSIEEVSAIPENATLIGDENTLATLSDVRTRLGKTEKAADSAKLGGQLPDYYSPKEGSWYFNENITAEVGWCTVAKYPTTSPLQPRGKFKFLLVTTGGSYTPLVEEYEGDISWNAVNCYFARNIGYSQYTNGIRLVNDGSHTHLQVYFRRAFSGIVYVPYNCFVACTTNQRWQWQSGALVMSDVESGVVGADFGSTHGYSTSRAVKAIGGFVGDLEGNADSATKLATPRKIWGQNFDGTENIDGDMEVNGDVVIKGNVVIEGSVTSGASYQSNPLSTISEDEVPSVEQQLRSQISSLEERIATLERIIAQNNG